MTTRSLQLFTDGELQQRVKQAQEILKNCDLCPRNCAVNRYEGELGICSTGRYARVASYAAHFGEEQPISGRYGSGTIFFASCNLKCCFCQNYDISHFSEDFQEISPRQLAAVMLHLQDKKCHNINLVSPSHVVPQILEALVLALEQGLTIPLVYNSSGYESPDTLALLDGVIDIYMPDFKFWKSVTGRNYCNAEDYPGITRIATSIMHEQVGDLVIDDDGIAAHGLLVRHLVMPDGLDETKKILRFIAESVSPQTYVNIMDQYRPCGSSDQHPELGRSISSDEYQKSIHFASLAGLKRLDQMDLSSFIRKLGIV